jgi:two-component system nitrogen regulation response regulator NtrX
VAETVLVVDDEPRILESVSSILEREGWSVLTARDGTAADAQLARNGGAALVLLDVALPGESGLALLERWKTEHPELVVVLMSGHGTIEMAVKATRLGAYDFLEKPLSADRLLLTLRNAARARTLATENASLREVAGLGRAIIGRSQAVRALLDTVGRVGPTPATALIQGESGTGKELVARALHDLSPRREEAFVAVNCAAIPEELVESELFGHEKGAFTGAVQARRGRFEEAHRGTLFLDEVGDMSPRTQARLLRALQEGEISRVGANATIKVDVRVLAATNRSLEKAIAEGAFREDLFYRLNVVPLVVPPLRERSEDTGLLAEHFLKLVARQMGRRPKSLDREALEALARHEWPGNVRELKNLIERLVILSPGETIHAADVALHLGGVTAARPVAKPSAAAARPESEADPHEDDAADDAAAFDGPAPVGSLRDQLDRAERAAIEAALREAGTVARAAERLGLERSHLYKKLRKHRLPY